VGPERSTRGAQESEYEGHCAPASLRANPSSSATIEFWQTTSAHKSPTARGPARPVHGTAAADAGRKGWRKTLAGESRRRSHSGPSELKQLSWVAQKEQVARPEAPSLSSPTRRGSRSLA